ncbi:Predicted dehydrogenase [Paenibacillus sophorae]|uniref:Gfo/Idh/MocA family oxidoreductase n=1 Tax=Paenibacillus sophorae TaxID=1333845 RepID=A0A1H8UG48_9BACL|nr:Gfo/Idh/MocA family oxidoreductase [Paenibacillus sophorae]QWU13146.1 Gfo/Idh/MocA family oxidoreductase [Paenibacillus sophorae]SEP02007.1 Predicted dehydrogenase [Paenibacillus sophorae]
MRTNKNIGVIGCAAILPRVLIEPAKSLEHLQVYGISSRTRSKAEAYAEQYGIPIVFDSYEALLESPDIDFVYILLCNNLHAEWIVRAIEAGKHVLVEKPLCLNSKEGARIMSAYERDRVHVLEGLMVQHHPWQQAVKGMVEARTYGSLRSIETTIGFLPKESFLNNYRSFPEWGGGSFYDLGCYWLQFLQAVTGLEYEDYRGQSSFDGPNSADWTFQAELRLAGGVHAGLTTSFEIPYQATHTIYFDYAVVEMRDFFRANLGFYKIVLKVTDLRMKETTKIEFAPQSYYVNQLSFFSDVIDGLKANIPLESSLERITLQEKIYESAKINV